MHTICVFGALK